MKNLISLVLLLVVYTLSSAQSQTVKEIFLYLPMNGNSLDSTKNKRDATLTGATFVADRFGNPKKALSFDGIDDKLVISDVGDSLPTKDYTISFWLKTAKGDQKSANTFMLMPDDASNRYSGSIFYSHSGTSSHFVDFGPISNRLFFQPDWPNGAWNFFEIVMTIDSLFLYKNDTLISFLLNPDHSINRKGDLTIGMGKDGYIKGVLDDFKITQNEAKVIPPPRKLVDGFLYLPMDGNSLDTTKNKRDATLTGAIFVADRFGNSKKALSFDGVDDKLVIPNLGDSLPTNNYTISFWLKTAKGDQKSANTFMLMPDDASNRYSSSIYYSHSGTSSHFVDFGPISNRLFFQPDWPNGAWDFFEIVVATDSLRLYKNDTLISFLLDPDHFINRKGDLAIGMGKDGYLKGVLDDFKITENKSSTNYIKQKDKFNQILFFPNPSKNGVYNFITEKPVSILEVTNYIGEIIGHEFSENELKINSKTGIYFLKGISNGRLFIEKLIVNN